jgi:O-acetyl-ADP-ribose deacetylase (regulator of RNase III)
MKQSNKQRAATTRQLLNDLETLIHGGSLGIAKRQRSTTVSARTPDVEEALKIFDRLRHSTSKETSSKTGKTYWRHPSILALGESDPIVGIVSLARKLVLNSIERGWSGPPYDPFQLAQLLGMKLLPTEKVVDARTLSDSRGGFVIEYNPNRPSARMRYSIAHEVGHTLFPDCATAVRNRATHEDMKGYDWQLETLCNIAAAELLMPFGTLVEELTIRPSVRMILELRQKYLVSCEAIVNRLIRLTEYPCTAFAARLEEDSKYVVEYCIQSPTFAGLTPFCSGYLFSKSSKAYLCTAPGALAKDELQWKGHSEPWQLEFVGISPNTGETNPRLVGLAFPPVSTEAPESRSAIRFVTGNATEPFGASPKLLVQIVNDKAVLWGGGFAKQLAKKYLQAQADFRRWAYATGRLKLGNVHLVELEPSLFLASIVAQHGFGPPTAGPRVRYGALFEGLQRIANLAVSKGASIHMPRIGAGEAGGSWNIIEGIIRDTLIARGVNVTVYDLPSKQVGVPRQHSLEFPSELAGEVM